MDPDRIKICIQKIILTIFSILVFLNIGVFVYNLLTENSFFGGSLGIVVTFIAIVIYIFVLILLSSRLNIHQNSKLTKYYFTVVMISIIPRIIWVLLVRVTPMSDFNTYHIIAEAMSHGKIIGNNYIALFPNYFSYPAFLSLFYRVLGEHAIVAQMLNVVLSAFVAILIFNIGKFLTSAKSGFVAAIIWALWPSQIFYSELIATETLFISFLLLSIFAFCKFLHSTKNNWSYFAQFSIFGILCAMTNSIRPLALIIIAAAIVWIFLKKGIPTVFKNKVLSKAAVVLVILISYSVAFQIIGMTISKSIDKDIAKYPFGFNLFVGMNHSSKGTWNEPDAKILAKLTENPGFNAQDVQNRFMELSLERLDTMTIKNCFDLALKKFGIMWAFDHDSVFYIKAGLINNSKFDFYKYENMLIRVATFYYHAMLSLCVVCATMLIKRKTDPNVIVLLCTFVLGLLVLHTAVEASGRYHFPAICLFSIISGRGIFEIDEKIQSKKKDSL